MAVKKVKADKKKKSPKKVKSSTKKVSSKGPTFKTHKKDGKSVTMHVDKICEHHLPQSRRIIFRLAGHAMIGGKKTPMSRIVKMEKAHSLSDKFGMMIIKCHTKKAAKKVKKPKAEKVKKVKAPKVKKVKTAEKKAKKPKKKSAPKKKKAAKKA